ncbi:MAG: hypothetical protein A2Z20_04090 [Bdellovibrionales bacterium RBG_16_40_8]|nr:MAG: hypothetical protein A2Z20_04090 [Bdellovibrionales bacterium RBG_16_40_8]
MTAQLKPLQIPDLAILAIRFMLDILRFNVPGNSFGITATFNSVFELKNVQLRHIRRSAKQQNYHECYKKRLGSGSVLSLVR